MKLDPNRWFEIEKKALRGDPAAVLKIIGGFRWYRDIAEEHVPLEEIKLADENSGVEWETE